MEAQAAIRERQYRIDVLSALKDGDSRPGGGVHAGTGRWVPASPPTAPARGGPTSAPQAFSLSLRPRARMFLPALVSRSWAVPQAGHVHVRTDSGLGPSTTGTSPRPGALRAVPPRNRCTPPARSRTPVRALRAAGGSGRGDSGSEAPWLDRNPRRLPGCPPETGRPRRERRGLRRTTLVVTGSPRPYASSSRNRWTRASTSANESRSLSIHSRPSMPRSHVSWRLASWRVAMMPRSRMAA